MNKLQWNKKVFNIYNDNKNLQFVLDASDMVVVNYFNDNQQNINIDILQNDNSYFVINLTSIANEACTVNINGQITGSNNRCVINARVLSNSEIIVNANVKAESGTISNEIIEDLKGINETGSVTFLPIFEIDTNEIDAEHFVTVGSFDESELFYLQTKGISLQSAYELLKKSFLYSLFSDEFIEVINKRKEQDE